MGPKQEKFFRLAGIMHDEHFKQSRKQPGTKFCNAITAVQETLTRTLLHFHNHCIRGFAPQLRVFVVCIFVDLGMTVSKYKCAFSLLSCQLSANNANSSSVRTMMHGL